MAVAYESQNSINFTNFDGSAKSLTITKPTGLAAGNLLLAVLGFDGINASDVDTPSGWTLITNAGVSSGTLGNAYTIMAFGKLATSGDAAATNFTFTVSGGTNGSTGQRGAGVLMRFSGSYMPDIFDADTDANGGTTNNYSGGVTPTVANNILVMGVLSNASAETTVSNYAVTTDNPTWTERLDTNYSTAGSDEPTMGVATGPRAAVTATGNYSADFASSQGESAGILICVQSQVDVTVSPAVITTTASVQAPSVTGGANVSPSVITVTTSVQAPTVSTPEADWKNTDKSSTSSVNNQDKS